jgi:hypothetical protein
MGLSRLGLPRSLAEQQILLIYSRLLAPLGASDFLTSDS